MAVDCGIELKKSNVAMISLYPGAVRTELVTDLMSKNDRPIDNIESKKVKQLKQNKHLKLYKIDGLIELKDEIVDEKNI